jgi:hypothetical protein
MPSDIFKRALFKASNKPSKNDDGIMQGFDDEEEEPDDEMMEELSQRSVKSPEILMNNLRGDIRSVDARYQELADMVGPEAAMETPPEVLAMLQSQLLAQQAPQGIGAVAPPGMTPPSAPSVGGAPAPGIEGMMPQGMMPPAPEMGQAPEAMAQGPAPQGFAYGGIVGDGGMVSPMGTASPMYGGNMMYGGGMSSPMYGGNMPPQGIQQLGGNPPAFASGGVVDIPQAGANYTQGSSYASDPGSIPQAGAVYTHGVAGAGRNGDTMLAHMSQSQADLLKFMGGAGSKNPKTDLPEYYMASAGPLLQGMGQRVSSAAQAMNTFGGRLLNPVLTKPTFEQGRSTLGTFTPRTAEGLELSYPTLTQRIGAATQPVREAISNMPAYQKAGAALTTIPGAAAVANAFGDGTKSPGMPMRNDGTDVPLVIGRDSAGNQVFEQPPAPPVVEPEKSIVEKAMNPPSTPKSVEDLVVQQREAPAEKKTLENRLDKYMQENLPVFQKYMGGDKEATQVQALLLLADAGLEYATTGARTGAMALANAAKKLPGGLGQLAAQESARKSQVAGAALTSGLQTLAAEDKATAALQRELIKKATASGELIPTDLGAGLTNYRGKQGEERGVRVDPMVTNSFLQSTFTPQVVKDDAGEVVGLNTPYARVTGTTSQTINTDKPTRERLANEIGRQEAALRSIDTAIKDYTSAFGPGAFITNLKNNTLVPVVPFLNPDVISEKKRTQILTSFNTAAKAIARTGDTGNIAVAEQTAAASLLGDKPGTFFADSETALARMLTVRTDIANQRLTTAQQLGWINQDIRLEVPNLGTKNDPIPVDKLSYVTNLAKDNPKGQVYIMTPKGVQQVILSTLQQ